MRRRKSGVSAAFVSSSLTQSKRAQRAHRPETDQSSGVVSHFLCGANCSSPPSCFPCLLPHSKAVIKSRVLPCQLADTRSRDQKDGIVLLCLSHIHAHSDSLVFYFLFLCDL